MIHSRFAKSILPVSSSLLGPFPALLGLAVFSFSVRGAVTEDLLFRGGSIHDCSDAEPALGDGADKAATFDVQVEVEEIVCMLPAYEVTNNGSGMFWGSGSAQMVRVGDRLFVSAFEAVPGAAPLNSARWALYERYPKGWKFCQRDEKDRTREPCPLATTYAGRLLMSVNPTLAPLAPNGNGVLVSSH
jgi:hypothetical protein